MRVSIIVPDYSLAQGINSVVDQFFECKEKFKSKGIDIYCVYDRRECFNSVAKRLQVRSGTKDKVKGGFKRSLFYNSAPGQAAAILYRFFLPAYKAYKNCLLNDNGEDIYIFQSAITAWLYLRKDHGKKVIYMTHMYDDVLDNLLKNYPHIKGTAFHKLLRRVCKTAVNKSDCVVTICKHSSEMLQKNYKPGKTAVIYNSFSQKTELQKVAKDSINKVRFVAASHLTYVKGIDLLMDAIELMDKDIRDKCEFHLYGDGTLHDEISERCKKNNIENVYLYGYTSKPYRFYADKDVFLLTSRMETLPMGIIEAMSTGLPVIATDVGAINEMITDKKTGLIIKPEAEDIRDAIDYCVGNKKDLAYMGEQAREDYKKRFSGDKWVDSFSELFFSI